ncbi:MAG: hypothetical protein WCV72_05255 [Patescibacteria group bacterium]|jgi:ribosomal protein S6--L-glutamate ligase
MQLVLINNSHNPKCEEYLLKAAKKRGLETKVISSKDTLLEVGKKSIKKNDLIYRVAVDTSEALLEQSILLGGNCTSFFKPEETIKRRFSNKLTRYVEFANAGIPIPQTIFANAVNDTELKKIAQKLGFPLIIKTLKDSLGRGVLVVDSYFSLKSISQFLVSKDIEFFFQKMVKESSGRHIRAVVLEKEILCAYEKSVPKKLDFRSNANRGFSKNRIVQLNPKIREIVLKAVAVAGVEFGGVDLLYTKNGFLVSEVNFPCNFGASQNFTGIDIAGKMLDFLVEKAGRNN